MQEKVMDEFEKWLEQEINTYPLRSGGIAGGTLQYALAQYRAFKAKDKAVEPLAVLADKKRYSVGVDKMDGGQWRIVLFKYGPEKISTTPIYKDTTYAACEAKAREWLNKLEDK